MSCSSDLCFWAGVSFERVDLLAVIGDIACRIQPCCRFPARFSLVECSFFLFHELVEFMEVDISEYRGDHSPNAKENVYQVESHVLPSGFHSRYPRGPLQPAIAPLAFSLQT